MIKEFLLTCVLVALLAWGFTGLQNPDEQGPWTEKEIACGGYLRRRAFEAGDREVPSINLARSVCRDWIKEEGNATYEFSG